MAASPVGLATIPLGAADGPPGNVKQPGQVKEQLVLLGLRDAPSLFVQRQSGIREFPS
jgi:hypothetical protein